MGSIQGPADVAAAFAALDAAEAAFVELNFDALSPAVRLRALERLERVASRLRAPQHTLINQLGAQASEQELGGTLRSALADRLRITKAEAGQRIDEAADLGQSMNTSACVCVDPRGPLPAVLVSCRPGELAEPCGTGELCRGRFVADLPPRFQFLAAENNAGGLAPPGRCDGMGSRPGDFPSR